MAELLDETAAIESTTVGVYRTAATVKGGRRFSFSALVVVGDRDGQLGMGYGKANQVPPAIEKAQKEGRRKMRRYPLQGRTVPHAVTGRFGACIVRILPASPGTGVIAGAAVRAPLEMLGIQDCLTKSFGSNNPKNLVKAVIDGLDQLRSKEGVQSLRGVELENTAVEEAIDRGKAFMPTSPMTLAGEAPAPAEAAQNKKGEQERGGGRGHGRGRGRGRGKGGPRSDQKGGAGRPPRGRERGRQADGGRSKPPERQPSGTEAPTEEAPKPGPQSQPPPAPRSDTDSGGSPPPPPTEQKPSGDETGQG